MPDAFVTTSSFVSPQFREFERFTTASLAAFIGPKVGPVYRAARPRPAQPQGQWRVAHHGVQWRRLDAEDGAREAGPDAAFRPCRRGARRRLDRRTRGPQAPHHLRHRRHQRRHRHRRRWRLRRDRCALDIHRRLPAADADARHPHDRRGRRIDRPCRPRRRLQGRAAKRRRGARSRRLWPGRGTAHRDRRQCRARPSRPERFPGRRHDAGRAGFACRDQPPCRARSACR